MGANTDRRVPVTKILASGTLTMRLAREKKKEKKSNNSFEHQAVPLWLVFGHKKHNNNKKKRNTQFNVCFFLDSFFIELSPTLSQKTTDPTAHWKKCKINYECH